MDLPLVSIIMPAYNMEKYIAEAIESVCAQSYQNWELIIIDDCSTDGTHEIMKAAADRDTRIRCLFNEKNSGVAITRNRGFSEACGEYIALLDSDDLWLPEKLERQVSLALSSKADIVYCSYAIIDEFGKKRCNDFIVPQKTNFDDTLIKSVISCSTALLSQELVRNYRFTSEYYHEDYVLWLSMLRDGATAVGVVDVLAKYRMISTSRASNKLKSAYHRWIIQRRFLKLSFLKCAGILLQYGLQGIKKYSKI